MTLKSIFLKPVGRPIEGVIKADDEASLRLEIDECSGQLIPDSMLSFSSAITGDIPPLNV